MRDAAEEPSSSWRSSATSYLEVARTVVEESSGTPQPQSSLTLTKDQVARGREERRGMNFANE